MREIYENPKNAGKSPENDKNEAVNRQEIGDFLNFNEENARLKALASIDKAVLESVVRNPNDFAQWYGSWRRRHYDVTWRT